MTIVHILILVLVLVLVLVPVLVLVCVSSFPIGLLELVTQPRLVPGPRQAHVAESVSEPSEFAEPYDT